MVARPQQLVEFADPSYEKLQNSRNCHFFPTLEAPVTKH
jgi:hypothetical protein